MRKRGAALSTATRKKIEHVTAASRARDQRSIWIRRVLPFPCEDPRNIPVDFFCFWHLMYGKPMRGYQAGMLNELWPHLYGSDDVALKMARQSGKTIPVGFVMGYLIVVENWPLVLMSSKEEKTRKIARILLRCMRLEGRKMPTDGIKESRFDMKDGMEPGFICMSGKPLSEREGETAKVVLADEAQDINHEAVWPDISPMLLSTGGIVLGMGIGGTDDSLMEMLCNDPDTVKINIKVQDVLRGWGVPDGRDEDYRKRYVKDQRQMRPEICLANYEGHPIPRGTAALYKYIVPWSEAYPGVPFDAERFLYNQQTKYPRLRLGIDWGKRVDQSNALLVASGKLADGGGREVVICGYNEVTHEDYTVQAERLVEWLDDADADVPYDQIQPELNGVGEGPTDILKKYLLENTKLRHSCEPVYVTDDIKWQECEKLAEASMTKRLIYLDEAADPDGKLKHLNLHMAAKCAANLRAVGLKYTSSPKGGLKINITHSDWNSALIAAMVEPPKSFVS